MVFTWPGFLRVRPFLWRRPLGLRGTAEAVPYGESARPTAVGDVRSARIAQTMAKSRAALLHESELARTDPDPQFLHRPMRYDIGLPSPVI